MNTVPAQPPVPSWGRREVIAGRALCNGRLGFWQNLEMKESLSRMSLESLPRAAMTKVSP
uniref:Uncharacterized protein n=1 Tax=Fagus sylvatica TaxID=28930 RepID=A0A2N9IFU7_FAGSY